MDEVKTIDDKFTFKDVFKTLNEINVNEHTEKKNGLTYLSWAWAWAKVKEHYPDAQYIVYERDTQFGPVNYFTDGKSCWVKTGVIIDGLEHIEYLPVMDFKNKSIPLNTITSFDVNKAIQRSLTKACARHGLGLYIYAGEDLPEDEKERSNNEETKETQKKPKQTKKSTGVTKEDYEGVTQEEASRFTNALINLKKRQVAIDKLDSEYRERNNDFLLSHSGCPTQNIGAIKPKFVNEVENLITLYDRVIEKLSQDKGAN